MCLCTLFPLVLEIVFDWKYHQTIENLLLGVFASAFVVFVTYVGAYHIEKRKTIGYIKKYCYDYILEISNLIPLLVDIEDSGLCSFNWNSLINKIKNDKEIHEVVVKLCKIHEERLYTVDGYFPFLKKSDNNLAVHRLLIAFAKINCSLQYCDRTYLLNNNVMCKIERDDISYSDEELKNYLKVILQKDNNDYKKFLELVKKVNTLGKANTVFDKNCENKCL